MGSSIPGVEGHVNCDVLVGYKAVYRVCFGMAMFFLLFSLLMIKVTSSQDPRAALHNGARFVCKQLRVDSYLFIQPSKPNLTHFLSDCVYRSVCKMRRSSNVPAFVTKLWTLVEDGDTNEFICWSQEGNSFLVLDEQRFAKEILPKFFKHNNMASFIRQLNVYGFRKVMHIDKVIVKQEQGGPVEFQHPYFKHGQDDLLENIKRKVSNARPEENKVRQEDLTKILASVQSVHSKQENIDARLATLKRENESLWREISELRQKHVHQQQLIKKLIQFIVTPVQNKHILNLKRKRPILMNGNGKKPKYIHEMYDDKVCVEQSSVNSLNGTKNSEISDDVIICDLTENDPEVTDPVKMMNSILNENGAISQNIILLGKLEPMDHLDSTDCSLEDWLSIGEHFGIDFDALEDPNFSTETYEEILHDKENLLNMGQR
ncbi:hypothetical protein Q5P01_005333 [Channa striata]|uniref:HSF-type DNA-binding domain-containing protein n=1 Tax=Channa striata TaxID=64152 RepID=A0AA88SYE5_CHASR|nr:hypothetical protein Q5P01_005333 [Channa striata]